MAAKLGACFACLATLGACLTPVEPVLTPKARPAALRPAPIQVAQATSEKKCRFAQLFDLGAIVATDPRVAAARRRWTRHPLQRRNVGP